MIPRAVRVAPESPLLQLDREFDFLLPDLLIGIAQVGSRVSFTMGRSKKLSTGFVLALLEASKFATSEIIAVIGNAPVLTPEIAKLSRKLADRQCVAQGEILRLAVPEHMPRSTFVATPAVIPDTGLISSLAAKLKYSAAPGSRFAYLSAVRPIEHQAVLYPDWAILFLDSAAKMLSESKSSLLIVPEAEEAQLLLNLATATGLIGSCIDYSDPKKAARFRAFHQALEGGPRIVVGSRAAAYAPVSDLGLICLFDDLDDSLRDQGSPNVHARELSLMRAGSEVDLILAANYRSPEVQRLIETGFLEEVQAVSKPPRIGFTAPETRLDAASFKVIRETLALGPMLVLLPNKGASSAAFCADCGTKLRCANCAGSVWSPTAHVFSCRLCKAAANSCQACGSEKKRSGRAGSERTVQELGRAFPGALVTEASSTRQPEAIRATGQIVVSTPGAAPRLSSGYAAVLILDTQVWLSRETLRAEQLALRDWQEALALMAPDGRAVVTGLNERLGRVISLQQLAEHGREQLQELTSLRLPPAVRLASISGPIDILDWAFQELAGAGAEILRSETSESETQALLRFNYSAGPAVATILRSAALKANPRLSARGMRRGLQINMDDQGAL